MALDVVISGWWGDHIVTYQLQYHFNLYDYSVPYILSSHFLKINTGVDMATDMAIPVIIESGSGMFKKEWKVVFTSLFYLKLWIYKISKLFAFEFTVLLTLHSMIIAECGSYLRTSWKFDLMIDTVVILRCMLNFHILLVI